MRTLREDSRLSLRALADKSGLAVDTLSLIENGKSSPSVSTLQKTSAALQVPMVAFFLLNRVDKKVIYTRIGGRKQAPFEHGFLEDLGASLSDGALEPFIVTLEPGDSLFFESHLPHCWQNLSAELSKKILILCPAGDYDHPIGRHFNPD